MYFSVLPGDFFAFSYHNCSNLDEKELLIHHQLEILDPKIFRVHFHSDSDFLHFQYYSSVSGIFQISLLFISTKSVSSLLFLPRYLDLYVSYDSICSQKALRPRISQIDAFALQNNIFWWSVDFCIIDNFHAVFSEVEAQRTKSHE